MTVRPRGRGALRTPREPDSAPSISRYSVTVIAEIRVVPGSVVSVITKNQDDQSWTPSNEGFVLLRQVSALLWRTFEPKHPFTPAPGSERYKP